VLRAQQGTWGLYDNFDTYSGATLPPAEVNRLQEQGWWFTFVRNPWARVISAWQMFEQDKKYNRRSHGGRPRTLEAVIELAERDWEHCPLDPISRPFPLDKFGTDSYLLFHLTPCSYHPLSRMHFVGQVENIKSDWEVVQDSTGIRVPLARINVTKHKHYRHYYTPGLRERVRQIYREDIDRFDYSF